MIKHTIYGVVLFSVILLGCDRPDNKAQSVEQMVITGLNYADGLPISVTVKDGVISDISRSVEGGDTLKYYLGPGLIDHQVNGYLSHSFVGGDLDAEGLKEVTEGFWSKGITTYLPTLNYTNGRGTVKEF